MSRKKELEKLVDIALLDLDTLTKYTIETNPERVSRPKLAIKELQALVKWLAENGNWASSMSELYGLEGDDVIDFALQCIHEDSEEEREERGQEEAPEG